MIPLPLQPKVAKKEKNKAVFEIEALYPGYGVTIGNTMRRVLLSSLEGAAITQVKIKNVPHEFSAISGILEDTVIIMLNLKQLRFHLFGSEPQKAKLSVKGEKEVKGKDFQLPSQVELINPDCHIATLTGRSSELEIEVLIERGVGYQPRDARKKVVGANQEKLEIGVIPVDAIFTPIKRVSFKVENMRVGERTDFDRLFLEVETDGTVQPEVAFFQASDILVKHFSLLSEVFRKEEEKAEAAVPVVKKEKKKSKEKKVSHKKNEKKKKGKKTK
ncbi:MAG: DNA-directed RNA polymerase subunit alpha [Candidatus Paceibacterota bacterium]